ncbi:hypothetical protein XELAEV_18004675mg [Xenopus laevis]|uniref:Uncharacterized protein n=1 Tax=Xenopus laevis TaxID=8355 RepID=A0A974BR08_XENLA|nr:hypothetical protein XELAEV_18004675mg [Xenopus laevis]
MGHPSPVLCLPLSGILDVINLHDTSFIVCYSFLGRGQWVHFHKAWLETVSRSQLPSPLCTECSAPNVMATVS